MTIEVREYTGRVRQPAELKASVQWWFGNVEDPVPPATYHPEWDESRRWFTWHYLRNPLHNFKLFVFGVEDRNYTVRGRAPLKNERSDEPNPDLGWCWSVIYGGEVTFPLPYVSFAGKRWVMQLGWQPSGRFSIKLNRREAEWRP